MTQSAKFKAYRASGGKLSFAEWSVLSDRLKVARKAKASTGAKVRAKTRQRVVKAAVPEVSAISNPHGMASGAQLWRLNAEGLLGTQITRQQAHEMISAL